MLAVQPKAFGGLFDEVQPTPAEVDAVTAVGIIPIRGPLMHHREYFFDSYESILSRTDQAIKDGARMIVLDIDSPGGLVGGCFDCASQLRTMCKASGVELRAQVVGHATSAAYALASAASFIGVSASAMLGSIGVIDTMIDVSAQNEAMGINIQLVTSGARKADLNPNSGITEAALAATKGRVDELASMFFALVFENGWGKSIEDIEGLQAAILTGEQAVTLQLASKVCTLAETIAFDAQRAEAKATETEKENTMATPMEDAVASLRSAAEGDDEEQAKKAKAALKAMGEDTDDKAEEPDDEKKEAKAEEPDDEKKEAKAEEPDDEKKEEASAMAVATAALAAVHTFQANAAAEKLSAERSELIASRADFAPEMVKVLASASTPIETVRDMCKNLPKGPTRTDRVAAAATVMGTRGGGQGEEGPRLAPDAKAILDRQMGITKMTTEVVKDPFKLTLGARRPVNTNGGK